jgi:hypothetical protein
LESTRSPASATIPTLGALLVVAGLYVLALEVVIRLLPPGG